MEYSKIDKLNVNPSLLGFGCMRFPKNEDGTIDEVEAERMLDHAIESGVTYIDTAILIMMVKANHLLVEF